MVLTMHAFSSTQFEKVLNIFCLYIDVKVHTLLTPAAPEGVLVPPSPAF